MRLRRGMSSYLAAWASRPVGVQIAEDLGRMMRMRGDLREDVIFLDISG